MMNETEIACAMSRDALSTVLNYDDAWNVARSIRSESVDRLAIAIWIEAEARHRADWDDRR